MPSTIKLLLQYDGSHYHGWQKQKHTGDTIQSYLESALQKILGHSVNCMASGRTDSGTHALGQVVHFQTEARLDNYDWPYSINSALPPDIRVRRAWIAPDSFHSLHDASSKVYKYVLRFGPENPLQRNRHWRLREPLDMDRLNEYCGKLLGTHDFKSFQTSGTEVATTVREVRECCWKRASQNRLILTIEGTGFLKQMVRNIVGCQVDLARKAQPVARFTDILAAHDRRAASETAPAHGLYLFRVRYPADLDNQCRRL